jgi:hypothetical protein
MCGFVQVGEVICPICILYVSGGILISHLCPELVLELP